MTTTPIVLIVKNTLSKLKEITGKLEKASRDIFESEQYKSYLKTLSKFRNYSFNNCMLIAMQCPEATHVAGYSSWQNNFKRNVVKGEKGIKIIAPSLFKENAGFDVAQTEGEPLPEIGANELAATLQMFVDSDLKDKGELSQGTRDAIAVQGYQYRDGVLVKQPAPTIPESPIKAAEMTTKQNLNMIDGVFNNTPTVAEIEAKARSGEVISVYLKETQAHYTWGFHGGTHDAVHAYAVDIKGIENGHIIGDIYELDYQTHIKETRKHARSVATVSLKYEDDAKLHMSYADFDKTSQRLIHEHGKLTYMRWEPEDQDALSLTLRTTREYRYKESRPATFKVRVQHQKPSIREQTAAGKQRLSQEHAAAPQKVAAKSQ